MSLSSGGRRRGAAVRLRWSLFSAATAISLVVGAGGVQAAGGALDPTFGSGGKVLTGFRAKSNDAANAVAVQKDGRIVVAGYSFVPRGGGDFALARYTTGGKLDASFGTGGKVLTDLGGDDAVFGAALQKDGKIVAAGFRYAGGSKGLALVRYTRDGTLDASFGSAGKVVTGLNAAASAVVIQANGRIIVGADDGLVGFTADGNQDGSFGRGGKAPTPFELHAVALQKDGKIVAAGVSVAEGDTNFALARYTPGGKLDASFGRGGKVLTDLGGPREQAFAVAVQADGKTVVAGYSDAKGDDDFALVRYTTSGKLDTSFGSGGKVLTYPGGDAHAVAVQKDGKIVAAGYGDGDFALVRCTTAGKLDTSFGAGGNVSTTFGTHSIDAANAVAVQADGKIVAAGQSGPLANGDFALVRYMP